MNTSIRITRTPFRVENNLSEGSLLSPNREMASTAFALKLSFLSRTSRMIKIINAKQLNKIGGLMFTKREI